MIDRTSATRVPARGAASGQARLDGQNGSSSPRSGRRATPSGGFFPVIRRWAIVIAVATGIATMVGYGLAQRATPTYQARAELLVGPLNADIATVRAATAATGTYVQLAGAPATIEVVARRTGVDREVLYGGVRTTAEAEARILVVRARAHTAREAAAAANGVADRLAEVAAADSAAPAGRLSLIDAATPPSSPISPRVEVITPLAAMGGLLAGLALVMVLELLGDPAGSVRDVREAAGAPALGVPAAARRPGAARRGEVVATELALLRPDARSILLTGVGPVDDGERLAVEVAAAWAASGRWVLVVDAATGDTITVMGSADGAEVPGAREAGPVCPTTLGDVAALVTAGGCVVVHAPPPQLTAGTLAWARTVDVTVLVCRSDTGRRGPLAATAESLRQVGADLAFVAVQASGRSRRRAGASHGRPAPEHPALAGAT